MNKYIIALFLNCFLFADINWQILKDKEILIKVFKQDYPQCRAEITINHPIDVVLDVIEDVENYKYFFTSIVISDINDSNDVRLAINMPFPFSDRDYTVKFKPVKDDGKVSYLYEPIITEEFPESKDYIRLVDARGGWTLMSLDNKNTLVRYEWNGDMRGDFPKWAYSQAWVRQGTEIMLDLKKEINKRNPE